jgi:hypothetical protein
MPLPLEIMLLQLNTIHLLGKNHSALKRRKGFDGRWADGRMFTRLQFAHDGRVHGLFELKL